MLNKNNNSNNKELKNKSYLFKVSSDKPTFKASSKSNYSCNSNNSIHSNRKGVLKNKTKEKELNKLAETENNSYNNLNYSEYDIFANNGYYNDEYSKSLLSEVVTFSNFNSMKNEHKNNMNKYSFNSSTYISDNNFNDNNNDSCKEIMEDTENQDFKEYLNPIVKNNLFNNMSNNNNKINFDFYSDEINLNQEVENHNNQNNINLEPANSEDFISSNISFL